MLSSYFDYSFVHLRQKVRLRPELSSKFPSTLGPNPNSNQKSPVLLRTLLQRALNSFADARDSTEMKISTTKTEVLHLSRNPDQCVLQVNRATLKQVVKFNYLGDTFTSDGRQDKELDT